MGRSRPEHGGAGSRQQEQSPVLSPLLKSYNKPKKPPMPPNASSHNGWMRVKKVSAVLIPITGYAITPIWKTVKGLVRPVRTA